jgi:Peptidase_C39 like family
VPYWSQALHIKKFLQFLIMTSSCIFACIFTVSSLFLVRLTERLAPVHAASSDQMNTQYDEFWRLDTEDDFVSWTMNGVAIREVDGHVALQLAPSKTTLRCSPVDIDGGAASYDAKTGLCVGVDPYAPGTSGKNLNYYNGGHFYFGTVVSPIHTVAQPITTVISSWNATTPAGTWIEAHIRVLQDETWTHWYKLPIWASDFSTITRHSVDHQTDATGTVAIDTFYTIGHRATTYQLSYTLFSTSPEITASIRGIYAVASNDAKRFPALPPDKSVWGKNLAVPQRSQMLKKYRGEGFGGGGEVWCSPTSTSMVMAYWSHVLDQDDLLQTVPRAAADTYDFTYQGTGNWPFNTAYAARYGLRAFVTRMYSMSQVEQWIKVGVPIVISIAYKKGELPGSPIPGSPGHLLVVRGFTENGDVITNDPAATNAAVEITYNREALEHAWQKYSNGTVYVIYPENWTTPAVDELSNW